MSSRKKYTHTVSMKIPYEFRCEHCFQDSGLLEAEFHGKSTMSKPVFSSLKDREKEQLYREAIQDLYKTIRKSRQYAEEEDYSAEFTDKCPHCGKPQSWPIKGMGRLPAKYVLKSLPVTVILCFVFRSVLENTIKRSTYLLISAGVVLLVGLISALIGHIRIGFKRFGVRDNQEAQIPQISWPQIDDEVNSPNSR